MAIGASVEITNVVSRWQPVDSIDEAFRWPSITMLSGCIRVGGHDCVESSYTDPQCRLSCNSGKLVESTLCPYLKNVNTLLS